MSVVATGGKAVTASTMITAAAGSVPLGVAFTVLGVPIWGLLAGLVGAFCSYLPRAGVDNRDIPSKLMGIFGDMMLGSWLAVAVIHLTIVQKTGIQNIPIEVVCGISAFGMQWLRMKFGDLFERSFGALLAAVASTITSWSKRKPAEPGP